MLLSSRWIQVGLALFLLCVGGSLLYSRHALRTTESEMERHAQLLGIYEQSKTRPTEPVNAPTAAESPGLVNTPDENRDTPISGEVQEALPDETGNLNIAEASLSDDTVSEEAPAAEVPVSPHGFGPYPEAPGDYFRTPVWAYPDPEFTPGHELMERVLIKLWKQGIYARGACIVNRRVYPVIRGTVYVKWRGDFIHAYIGHPDNDDEQIISILEDGGIPAGITVLDYDTAGIDPYQFLNLLE